MQIAKVLLVGSLSISPAFADEGIYNTNLANKDVAWWAVLSNARRPYVDGVGIVSRGPLLIDVNHREGALLVGPLAVLLNGHKPGEYSGALGRVDLTDTVVRLKLKIDGAVAGRAVFWFQSELKNKAHAGNNEEMPPRYVNYFYNRDIQKEAMANLPIEIGVRPDLNDWTCLGRNPVDVRPIIGSAAKYTCAINQTEFAEAMSKPLSTGVLFLLPPKRPDGSNWLLYPDNKWTPIMDGVSFSLSEFEISREPTEARH